MNSLKSIELTPTLILSPMTFHPNYMRSTRKHFCCDETQYAIYCEAHFVFMGCRYCNFNIDLDCEEQH